MTARKTLRLVKARMQIDGTDYKVREMRAEGDYIEVVFEEPAAAARIPLDVV